MRVLASASALLAGILAFHPAAAEEEKAVLGLAAAEGETPARDYFVVPRSWGTKRDEEPPSYVRTLSETGIDAFEEITWLDVGLEQRFRYEYRQRDFTREEVTLDQPFLVRHRAFFGVKEIADPLRFSFELEDARIFNSQFEPHDGEKNHLEPIQAFAELYFRGALGEGRPLSLKAGRMAFEYVDRRLIGRNEWRNTTNTFDGFRVHLGELKNDWQIDLLAVQPVTRLFTSLDRRDRDRWLLAAFGDWRGWIPFGTFEPFYIRLLQREGDARVERDIHTAGMRVYGQVGASEVDYDLQGMVQFGRHGDQKHRAFAATSELGYTFTQPWRSRVGAFAMYNSGDKDPDDDVSGRFERLFGFVRPMSDNIYVQFENLVMAKVMAQTAPSRRLGFAGGYGRYWLASATDRWNNGNLRDLTGQSGTYLGEELFLRAQVVPHGRILAQFGYVFFRPGEFPIQAGGRTQPSHFFYTQVLVRAFE